jgi:RNA polymerase sigma factor (sigma-70 family)
MGCQEQVADKFNGVDPKQLWYVPDRRLMTKQAASAAEEIVAWIRGEVELDNEPDDVALFAALHTCAYRAVRNMRSKQISDEERADWVSCWEVVREFVVEKNLGLAYSMIGRFSSKNVDEDDMLSDAMLGLSRAVDRFNPWKGYRFSTYACNVIARALMRRGKRETNRRRLFPVQYDVTFEKPVELPDGQEQLYVERLSHALNENLGELTDLETSILNKRFTFERRERLTFQEIGRSVGLSKERVRQIQNVALGKLREVLAADPVLQ